MVELTENKAKMNTIKQLIRELNCLCAFVTADTAPLQLSQDDIVDVNYIPTSNVYIVTTSDVMCPLHKTQHAFVIKVQSIGCTLSCAPPYQNSINCFSVLPFEVLESEQKDDSSGREEKAEAKECVVYASSENLHPIIKWLMKQPKNLIMSSQSKLYTAYRNDNGKLSYALSSFKRYHRTFKKDFAA